MYHRPLNRGERALGVLPLAGAVIWQVAVHGRSDVRGPVVVVGALLALSLLLLGAALGRLCRRGKDRTLIIGMALGLALLTLLPIFSKVRPL